MSREKRSSSVGIDALFQYASSAVRMFSGMLFYVIILRMFDTTSVGAIAMFLAIIGLFSIIFTSGLNFAAQHFTSYSIGQGDFASAKKIFTRILGVSSLLSGSGFVALFILSPEISVMFLHSPDYVLLIRLLSVDLMAMIMFGVMKGVLLGMQNFRLYAKISIVIWISYYFGAIVLAFFVRSIELIIIDWIVGMTAGALVTLFLISRKFAAYKGPAYAPTNRILFAYSVPVLFSALITYGATYADRFVVAGLMNLGSLGVYNLSLLVVSGIAFLTMPFNNILMPKFSEFFGRGDREKIQQIVKTSGLLLSSLYVPIALGISALSPMIMDLLGGKDYLSGSLPLSIIVVVSALFIIQAVLVPAIASVRRTSVFIRSSAVALCLNVVLSVILIPRFDLIGAAIGFSSVYVATFAVILYYSRKEKVCSFDVNGIAKVWAAAITMSAVVYVMQLELGHSLFVLPLYVVSGTVVYLLILKKIRIFREESKQFVLSLFPAQYSRVGRLVSLLT